MGPCLTPGCLKLHALRGAVYACMFRFKRRSMPPTVSAFQVDNLVDSDRIWVQPKETTHGTVHPTYLQRIEGYGLSVLTDSARQPGDIVAIYNGEMLSGYGESHYRSHTTPDSGTHFLSLKTWCRGGPRVVDGSIHSGKDGKLYNLEYFVHNGVGSFLNSGRQSNCKLMFKPKLLSDNPAMSASYFLPTFDQQNNYLVDPLSSRSRGSRSRVTLFIFLVASKHITAGSQLIWDYKCDVTSPGIS